MLTQFVALQIVLSLASVTAFISSLEHLKNTNLYSDESLISWEIIRTRASWMSLGRPAQLLNLLFSIQSFIWILRLRAALCLILPTILWSHPLSLLTALTTMTIALLSTLIALRSPFGQEGSDQMVILIFTALGLSMLMSGSPTSINLALIFIAAQSALSYTTAGAAKLVSPIWRSGKAITGIMSAKSYGNIRISAILHERKWLSVMLCHCIIAFQLLFPIGVIIGGDLLVFTLCCGAAFHLAIAMIMGLNCFLWSFLAPYPAILYVRYLFE